MQGGGGRGIFTKVNTSAIHYFSFGLNVIFISWFERNWAPRRLNNRLSFKQTFTTADALKWLMAKMKAYLHSLYCVSPVHVTDQRYCWEQDTAGFVGVFLHRLQHVVNADLRRETENRNNRWRNIKRSILYIDTNIYLCITQEAISKFKKKKSRCHLYLAFLTHSLTSLGLFYKFAFRFAKIFNLKIATSCNPRITF